MLARSDAKSSKSILSATIIDSSSSKLIKEVKNMKIKILSIIIVALTLVGCDKHSDVTKTEAKTQSVAQTAPVAPTMSYKPLLVPNQISSEFGPFTVKDYEINYITRAGVDNILEQVVQYPTATGFVAVEKAYSFGDKYLLIVSTGESGNSCPATTYAFTYDTKSESVTGKILIDGCSEIVEALADGNKLTVKKDGNASVFYNGDVK